MRATAILRVSVQGKPDFCVLGLDDRLAAGNQRVKDVCTKVRLVLREGLHGLTIVPRLISAKEKARERAIKIPLAQTVLLAAVMLVAQPLT